MTEGMGKSQNEGGHGWFPCGIPDTWGSSAAVCDSGSQKRGKLPKAGDAWFSYSFKSNCESCSDMSNSLQPHGLIVHGILQARILEWVAFPFSRRSSQPTDWTQVSRIAGRFFTNWAIREALLSWNLWILCIFWMLTPYDILFANIFSHSIGSIFIFLYFLSLTVQKLFNLMYSQ